MKKKKQQISLSVIGFKQVLSCCLSSSFWILNKSKEMNEKVKIKDFYRKEIREGMLGEAG